MKTKYLVIALFSLGLICVSCGKKKKGEHKKEHTEQHANGVEHDHHGHEEAAHEHNEKPAHDDHEGHDH